MADAPPDDAPPEDGPPTTPCDEPVEPEMLPETGGLLPSIERPPRWERPDPDAVPPSRREAPPVSRRASCRVTGGVFVPREVAALESPEKRRGPTDSGTDPVALRWTEGPAEPTEGGLEVEEPDTEPDEGLFDERNGEGPVEEADGLDERNGEGPVEGVPDERRDDGPADEDDAGGDDDRVDRLGGGEKSRREEDEEAELGAPPVDSRRLAPSLRTARPLDAPSLDERP